MSLNYDTPAPGRRCREHDLDKRAAEKRILSATPCPGCNVHAKPGHCDCMPPQPAEARTELGAESGRPRMGLLHRWERGYIAAVRRPGFLFGLGLAVAVLGFVFGRPT